MTEHTDVASAAANLLSGTQFTPLERIVVGMGVALTAMSVYANQYRMNQAAAYSFRDAQEEQGVNPLTVAKIAANMFADMMLTPTQRVLDEVHFTVTSVAPHARLQRMGFNGSYSSSAIGRDSQVHSRKPINHLYG